MTILSRLSRHLASFVGGAPDALSAHQIIDY